MAENNNNNAFTVTITPETFNGIITKNPNGDGTYNVTYTSLTEDQIHDIGQQFAKHLSDTDENGNSKAGLHKVALTGDYTQLEKKPSASNLQGFHEVAFSGQASALDNGTGNNVTFLTKTAFDASVAGKIKQSDVNDWSNKATISDINNLKGNPTENNDTLEKLEQHKAQIVYINVENDPYNYYNFGINNFFNTSDSLINDLFQLLNSNKIIILITSNGNWMITDYFSNNDTTIKAIFIQNIPIENYYLALENISENIVQQESESNEDFNTRYNTTLLNEITTVNNIGILINDSNIECSYFKFFAYNIQAIIASLNNRITALEEANQN